MILVHYLNVALRLDSSHLKVRKVLKERSTFNVGCSHATEAKLRLEISLVARKVWQSRRGLDLLFEAAIVWKRECLACSRLVHMHIALW